MSDYQTTSVRFVQLGLNLRDTNDKVGEGEWVRLHNVRSVQESQLQPREGSQLFVSTGVNSPVHTLKRLTDSTLLVGVGDQLFRNGVAFVTSGYSGNPLSVLPYRPSLTSASWAYVADSNKMRKLLADGTDYKWGVTGPAVAAPFAADGAGNLDSTVSGGIVYDWRYSYRSSVTGAESNPSPEATGITLTNQRADVTVQASTDPQIDQIRIYRRGGTLNTYRLSMTVANVSGTYQDNNADSSIAAAVTMSTVRDVPFTSKDASGNTLREVPMAYTWGPFVGKYILACGAPNQPGYVFWTNAQLADEADPSNNVEVTPPYEPLQNGFILNSLPYTFSKDDLYALDFGQPGVATFVPRKTPCGRGLSAPWAFCVGGDNRVYFLGNDGLYATDGQSQAENITEERLRPLFQGISVSNLLPVDYTTQTALRMEYSQQKIVFHYQDTSGAARVMEFHTLYRRFKTEDSELTEFVMGYDDENVSEARLLLGASNGNVYETDPSLSADGGVNFNVNARTGSLDMGAPTTLKEYGNVLIDCDPQGNIITVQPYTDTEATPQDSFILSGNGRQKFTRSLGDVRAYNMAFDFTWATNEPAFGGIIYQMDILWRMEEEPLRHWEFITTHGLVGWQHIRDAYFCVISHAPIGLTINVDGVDYTYTIPSTNGRRLKQYIKLQPVKGKVFTYTLDSPDADFRLFGNECEVRVKPWITSLGYQLTTPFQDNKVPA